MCAYLCVHAAPLEEEGESADALSVAVRTAEKRDGEDDAWGCALARPCWNSLRKFWTHQEQGGREEKDPNPFAQH